MIKLVIGKSGFLGREFIEHMNCDGIGRSELDMMTLFDKNTKARNKILKKFLKNYDVIINCIGISNTRYCEDPKNWEEVNFINGTIPKILSTWCNENNKKFVQISTGCLYDESHHPCTEDSFRVAHCNYTVSKFSGELGCNFETDLIIRPRLLFSDKVVKGNNLLSKLLTFDKYVDEFNSITSNKTIVNAVDALLMANQSGAFNVCNQGHYTIFEIAKMLHDTINNMAWTLKIDFINKSKITAVELRDSQGLYLVNNVMDLTKLLEFYNPPTVQEAISDIIVSTLTSDPSDPTKTII